MKVIFMDKQRMTFESVPKVVQIQRQPNRRGYEWVVIKDTGPTEYYKCSRFEVERIELD